MSSGDCESAKNSLKEMAFRPPVDFAPGRPRHATALRLQITPGECCAARAAS